MKYNMNTQIEGPQPKRLPRWALWAATPLMLVLLSRCIGTDILEIVVVPERIEITRIVQTLEVGTEFTFEADFFDNTGTPAQQAVAWRSSNPEIIAINSSGTARALQPGMVTIFASVGELTDSIEVEAGQETIMMPPTRMGTFRGLNNYTVNGGFSVAEDNDGIVLTFAEDFSTQNGPGLYVYMSNEAGSVVGGLEVARLAQTRGSHSYTIPGINARTYDHVLIYCKPFGLPFGTGALE